jgi:menaquinone-dependent protoporphyrinogen IX oxidase
MYRVQEISFLTAGAAEQQYLLPRRSKQSHPNFVEEQKVVLGVRVRHSRYHRRRSRFLQGLELLLEREPVVAEWNWEGFHCG